MAMAARIATKRCSRSWGSAAAAAAHSRATAVSGSAGLHGTSVQRSVDATRGAGPVRGPDNDPATRGDTPDDGRADDVHMGEPKEVTKQKVAEAQEEPAGLQGSKLMPGFDSPINKDAKPQHTTVDRGSKYHTWARQHARGLSTSPVLPLQETTVKGGADVHQVRQRKVTAEDGVTWMWWEAPKGFPGHFGVYRADPEGDASREVS